MYQCMNADMHISIYIQRWMNVGRSNDEIIEEQICRCMHKDVVNEHRHNVPHYHTHIYTYIYLPLYMHLHIYIYMHIDIYTSFIISISMYIFIYAYPSVGSIIFQLNLHDDTGNLNHACVLCRKNAFHGSKRAYLK